MKKKYEHSERKGLPGGPNEVFSYVTGVFSEDGYKSYSSDVNNPFNIIDSGRITMEDVEFPVMGIDNLGNSEIMMPDGEYEFPGDMVFEIPMAQKGGAYKATSPEDYAFRMQMLSDSLALHQLGEEHYDEFMKAFGDLPYEDNRQPGKPYIDPFKMGKRYNQEKQRELFPKYMEWRRENRGFKDFFTENPALGVFKPDRVNLSLQKADGDKMVYEEDIRPQISQTVMNMMIEPDSFIAVSTRPLQTNRPLEYDPNLTGEFKKTFTRSDGSTYDEYIYHLKDNNPYHVRRYQKPTQEVLPPDDMRNPEDWDKYLPDLPVSNTLKKLVPKKPTLSAEEIEKRRKAEEIRIKKEEELKKQKELETTISNTEKAFKAKRDLEQQIAEDKYMMQNPDIPDGYQLVQGYRDPLYGKTIGDKYVYMGPSSDNKPDIPVGPTLEDYQIWKNTQTQNPSKYTKLSGTFKKGGNVSWNFKGKTYSGTLIPSMEDANNRYARTHNGKIKTLPKAQYGLEKLPELQGGGFKKRKYTNTRVPKQRQQRLRNFFESIGEKIQDRRDSRQMIPEESALQEEKVLPTYNLPDTETLSKGDVNIKKGADDRVAFLTSPIYYENAVNTYGSEEEAQKVIQNQLNRIGDVDVILPGTGDSDPQEGGAAAYFDPKTNTIGYADMYENDTGLQHLTTHELDHKSAVQGANPDGSPILYPEFTMYNELDLSNKSDLKDYNYNFQDPGDVILNDRGYLTDEELKQRTKDYHSYLQNPAEFRERLNAVKQYMVKNNFNYMDATGDEIIDYMYNIPQIGDTPGEGSLSVDDIERASKEGLVVGESATLSKEIDELMSYNRNQPSIGDYSESHKNINEFFKLDKKDRKEFKSKYNDYYEGNLNKREKRKFEKFMDEKGFNSGINLYSLANSKADNIKDFIIEDEGYDKKNPGRPDNERYNKYREEFNKKLIDGYFQNVDEEGNPTWKIDKNIMNPGQYLPGQDPKFIEKIFKELAEERSMQDLQQAQLGKLISKGYKGLKNYVLPVSTKIGDDLYLTVPPKLDAFKSKGSGVVVGAVTKSPKAPAMSDILKNLNRYGEGKIDIKTPINIPNPSPKNYMILEKYIDGDGVVYNNTFGIPNAFFDSPIDAGRGFGALQGLMKKGDILYGHGSGSLSTDSFKNFIKRGKGKDFDLAFEYDMDRLIPINTLGRDMNYKFDPSKGLPFKPELAKNQPRWTIQGENYLKEDQAQYWRKKLDDLIMSTGNDPGVGIMDTRDLGMGVKGLKKLYAPTPYLIKKQKGGEPAKQKNWLENYIQSPMYFQRLQNEFPNYTTSQINKEISTRLSNLQNVDVNYPDEPIGKNFGYISGKYHPDKNAIDFEPTYRPESFSPSSGFETIPLHEFGHSVDRAGKQIPEKTKDLIKDAYDSGSDYYNDPSEVINRLMPLRYILEQEGIWNVGSQKFTDSMYDKMLTNPNVINNVHINDILDGLKGDPKQTLKKLLNDIAAISSDNINIAQKGAEINLEGLKKGIAAAESLSGELMMNPQSTATGLYGQRFSEIESLPELKGISREKFSKDIELQNKIFDKRFYEGIGAPSLERNANELYDEYSKQIENFDFSKEDIAALSNFLGRQGTRNYLGLVIRDKKELSEALPNVYGDTTVANKTPEEYLKIIRPFYKQKGGEKSDIEMYKGYIYGEYDGTDMEKEAEKIYNKLNRVYRNDAKALGMSIPNYIMTNVFSNVNN